MADDQVVTGVDEQDIETLNSFEITYKELEEKVGALTEQGKKDLEDIKGKLEEYKKRRNQASKEIVDLSIEKSEIQDWASISHEISDRLFKDPETASFKSMVYLLKKSFETFSYEKLAPTIENSVNEWLRSASGSESPLMTFLFGREAIQVIYLAWPRYFLGFEYEPGSEKESDFWMDPKTWAGVSEAFYQEAAWRGLFIDQLYAQVLFYETKVGEFDNAFNSGMPEKDQIEKYEKDKAELKRQKEQFESDLALYKKNLIIWENRLLVEKKADFDTLSIEEIEALARQYALASVKDETTANQLYQDKLKSLSAARSASGLTIPVQRSGPVSNSNEGSLRVRSDLSQRDTTLGTVLSYTNDPLRLFDELAKGVMSNIIVNGQGGQSSNPEPSLPEFGMLTSEEKTSFFKIKKERPYATDQEILQYVLTIGNVIAPNPQDYATQPNSQMSSRVDNLSAEEKLWLDKLMASGLTIDQALENVQSIVAKNQQPIPIDPSQNQSSAGGPPLRVTQGTLKSSSSEAQHDSGGYRSPQTSEVLDRLQEHAAANPRRFTAQNAWGQVRNQLFGEKQSGQVLSEVEETPALPASVQRAVSRSERGGGMLGGIKNNISQKVSKSFIGSARNALIKRFGTQAAGTAVAGATTAGGAGAAAAGTAAVAGGPVTWAIAAGAIILSKRDAIKHYIEMAAKIGIGYFFTILQGVAIMIRSVLGPLAAPLGFGSSTFIAGGFVPQTAFAATPAVASAGSTPGFLGGVFGGGAGAGGAGGGGTSGFGLAVSSSPIVALSTTACAAIITCVVIIPAAFAQPPGPVGQQGKVAFTVQKTADPSSLPDYNGEATTINYKLKISLSGSNIQINKITDKKTLQKDSGDIDKGETTIDNSSLKVDPNGDLTFDYTYEISGLEFKDSTLLNTITVEATDTSKDGPANKITQSSSFIVWINKKPVYQPYGFPATGTIFSLDWHFGSLPAEQGVHWSCFFVIKPVVCSSDGQTDISGHSAIIGGADVSGAAGTRVKSTLDGKVIDTQWRPQDVGGVIYIRTCNDFPTCEDKNLGPYVAEFEHLNNPAVKVGDIISRGTDIGTTTTKANAPVISGSHVHYQVILITSESNGEITGGSNVNFTDPNNSGLCSQGKIEPSFDEVPEFKQAIFNYPASGFPSVPSQYIVPPCR